MLLGSHFLLMLPRKAVPVQFTASPKKPSSAGASSSRIDLQVEEFDYEIHSVMYQTLLFRKTAILVAKQFLYDGGLLYCFTYKLLIHL